MTPQTTLDACQIIEGGCGYTPTETDILQAWSLLISTGQVWKLQPFYVRNASMLIDTGVIDLKGTINYDIE